MQPALLLSTSPAAVCVQPNITWHAYDAAWSAQQEGVNRQKSCFCNTAVQTTLLPGFFHHMATAAAVHLIHWLTVWGFPVLGAYCKNECIMQRGIPFPYQNSTSDTGAKKSFPGLVILCSRCQHHARLEKKSSKPSRVEFIIRCSNGRVLLFPNKNKWKAPLKLKDGINVLV